MAAGGAMAGATLIASRPLTGLAGASEATTLTRDGNWVMKVQPEDASQEVEVYGPADVARLVAVAKLQTTGLTYLASKLAPSPAWDRAFAGRVTSRYFGNVEVAEVVIAPVGTDGGYIGWSPELGGVGLGRAAISADDPGLVWSPTETVVPLSSCSPLTCGLGVVGTGLGIFSTTVGCAGCALVPLGCVACGAGIASGAISGGLAVVGCSGCMVVDAGCLGFLYTPFVGGCCGAGACVVRDDCSHCSCVGGCSSDRRCTSQFNPLTGTYCGCMCCCFY